MPRILQVRGIPDDVHRTLKRRAAKEGRALSELLRDELMCIAARPSHRELFRRISQRESAALDRPST